MKSLPDGGVGERGRRLRGELVALRGEHGQRSAAQARMVLEGRRRTERVSQSLSGQLTVAPEAPGVRICYAEKNVACIIQADIEFVLRNSSIFRSFQDRFRLHFHCAHR